MLGGTELEHKDHGCRQGARRARQSHRHIAAVPFAPAAEQDLQQKHRGPGRGNAADVPPRAWPV